MYCQRNFNFELDNHHALWEKWQTPKQHLDRDDVTRFSERFQFFQHRTMLLLFVVRFRCCVVVWVRCCAPPGWQRISFECD
jgi:hypothetical protein